MNLNDALQAGSIEAQHEMKPLCRYCGLPLSWPRTDDPRSEECSNCLTKAQMYEDAVVTASDIFEDEENPPWEM